MGVAIAKDIYIPSCDPWFESQTQYYLFEIYLTDLFNSSLISTTFE